MKHFRADRPMYADDMFLENTQQIFSVRTGEFIGYRSGQFILEIDRQDPDQQPEVIDENQLTLF